MHYSGCAGGGDERAALVRAPYYYKYYSLYCVVLLCIAQGVRAAETNALHWSALHYACFSASNVHVVERLVQAGGVCAVYVVHVL